MTVKCIRECQDKYTGEMYEVNKEYEVKAERGKELVKSGYFELVKEESVKEVIEEEKQEEVKEVKTIKKGGKK